MELQGARTEHLSYVRDRCTQQNILEARPYIPRTLYVTFAVNGERFLKTATKCAWDP